jgi:hypothetical protein
VIAYMMTRGLSDTAAIEYLTKRRPFITLSVMQRKRLSEFADYIARYRLDYSADNALDGFTTTQEAQADVPAIGTDDALVNAAGKVNAST